MTAEELLQAVAGGESLNVEFKGEESGPLNDADLVETAVCLANRPGNDAGFLLIGVEDDGRVTGARPRHEGGKIDARRVEALISNRTRPAMTVRAEVVPVGDATVLVVEIASSRTPVGTTDGRYVRRALGGRGTPECVPFHFHEMQAAQVARGALDYSSLVVSGATWDDLDPLEFERFRRAIREGGGQSDRVLLELADVELAKALGAVEANHRVGAIRMLALLLFGREESLRRLVPTHEVAFQAISGTAVTTNDFFRWPLLRVMEELMARFRARNREQEIVEGLIRIAVPDYPERAFREIVANALIHRDYALLGAVHVQWHDDRIEVSNPGGFPEGVRLDNLLITPPRPRNLLLADAFKRAGIVERTARGIDTIFEEQLRHGRPAPNYERSTQTSVVVALPGGKANLSFVQIVAEQNRAGTPLGLDGLLVLNELWQRRRLTTGEASVVLQRPDHETRRVLERLVEAGLIEGRGDGRGRAFTLSATTYRRLGEPAAYVRQAGVAPLQREQMVRQFVETHGSISRREVSELCGLTAPQAYKLLKKLEGSGFLRPVGRHGRGVRYEKKH